MHLRFRELPLDRQQVLKNLAGPGEPPAGTFRLGQSRRWLLWTGLSTLAAGTVAALILGAAPRPLDGWAARAGLLGLPYGALALVEYGRILAGGIRPFLLVTPREFIRCVGAHRPLVVHRLTQVRDFHRVEEYSGRAWTGLGYVFTLDGGEKMHFTLRRKVDQARVDGVLALARAAGRGEPLPDLPGCRLGLLAPAGLPAAPAPTALDQLLDPASETWAVILAVMICLFIPYAIFR